MTQRSLTALAAFGLLALVFVIALNAGNDRSGSLVNARSGEPLTLEAVQSDVEWHRETARKLRDLR
ncbi:MAG: hypothetical protein ACFCUW_09895 [Kiloniellaceae bacterium]